MLGFGRRRREQEEAGALPPVVVPADAVRPGEDDRALVRALIRYVNAMRADGAYAFAELHPDAVSAYAVDAYLAKVARGGHAAYLAEPPSPTLLERCQEGLERVAPALAKVHRSAARAVERSPGGAETVATARLDKAFAKAGGDADTDAPLAGLIAAIDGLEVVPADALQDRLAEVAAANPARPARLRDLRIAELHAGLTSPVAAGTAVILNRTIGRPLPFALRPLGGDSDGGEAEAQWDVETAKETFRAAWYPDRLVLFRARAGSDHAGLGHLAHDKIELTCDWADRSHAALAAWLGLEELGHVERLETIVFDRRKTLKRSGAEAVSFHLALEGMRDLALVVFPESCAIVDPRTNERLAEYAHATLDAEAAAHARRLAVLIG
ncbi:MAG TPA: hypothetical protein VMM55_04615 [Thermohalobaculum sp.]|nr:hypothetical protein [Thermohalobaculum sp.]